MNLSDNKITDVGTIELAKKLRDNAKLESIDLCNLSLITYFIVDGNAIGDEGALALAEVLRAHTTICEVGIGMSIQRDRVS